MRNHAGKWSRQGQTLRDVCIFRTGSHSSRFSLLSELLAVFLTSLLVMSPAAFAESRVLQDPAPSSGVVVAPSASPNSTDPGKATPNPALVAPTAARPSPNSTDGCPLSTATPRTDDQRHAAERWGDISIAQPKIWQYERVNTYLDGLLRDVEGVSVSDLTQLDPNSQNAGAIKFIQSALELGVQYNQVIGVTNQTALQTWQAQYQQQEKQIAQYNSNIQQLREQQDSLTKQIVAQSSIVTHLQQLQAAGTALTPAQSSALTNATQSLTNLESALTSVNTAISNAGTAPTLPAAPTLQSPTVAGPASGTSMSSTFYGLTDLLNKLPSGIQDEITSALKSPSYPATKKLDSFITLLYERLAREISALQDDTTRDPNTEAFLLQFDVGLYPAGRTKNHMARVEFKLDDNQCKGCKIYSVYPGQSSYNVANYTGESRRRSFWGNLSFLIGLGVSGAYSRQEDTLHGSLVQSVYTSGFQDIDEEAGGAVQRFGWNYGAAPFEMYVTPGVRSTFAILTVPRKTIAEDMQNGNDMIPGCFALNVQANWSLRNDPYYNRAHYLEGKIAVDSNPDTKVTKTLNISLPGTAGAEKLATTIRNEPQILHVKSFEYNTIYPARTSSFAEPSSIVPTSAPSGDKAAPIAATLTNNCQLKQCAAVLIGIDQPIDPNLVVTVNGTVLRRVRDWRGRATSILSPAESLSDLATAPSLRSLARTAPGLLEAEQIAPDTWYALDSRRLLLVIANTAVPDEEFPTIRIADPSKKVVSLPQDLDEGFSEVLINGFHFAARDGDQFERFLRNRYKTDPDLEAAKSKRPQDLRAAIAGLKPGGPYPHETFLPLFLSDPHPKRFWAAVGETGTQLLIGFLSDPPEWHTSGQPSIRYHWLGSRTQVILEDRDLDLAWSLSCYPQGDELVCELPMSDIRTAYTIARLDCASGRCPAIPNYESITKFVSTLQAWVEQYDPSGENAFYSPAPVSLGLFPVEPSVTVLPWQADSVDSDKVMVEGCQYITGFAGTKPLIDILGELPRSSKHLLNYSSVADSAFQNCGRFELLTTYLSREAVVFRTRKSDGQPDYSSKSPHVLPMSLLRPSFQTALVEPNTTDNEFRPTQWTLTLPVVRAYCNDSISSNRAPTPPFKWLAGGLAGKNCADFERAWGTQFDKKWQLESLNGRVRMQFQINRADVPTLPSTTYMVRGSSSTQVATLPSLRHLILPSRLTVQQLSPTQFALKGENAGAIAAVAVQNGTKAQTYPAASAGDYAIVTLPETKPTEKSTPTPTPSSPQITSLTPPLGKAKDKVRITGKNLGAAGKATVTFDGQEAKATGTGTSLTVTVPDGVKPGKFAVVVKVGSAASNPLTFTIGLADDAPHITSLAPPSGPPGKSVKITGTKFGAKQADSKVTFDGKELKATNWTDTSFSTTVPAGEKTADFVVTVSAKASNGVTYMIPSPTPAPAKPPAPAANGASSTVTSLAAGTYALLPLFYVGADPKNPYIPIDATDDQGKPLTFIIPPESPPPAQDATKGKAPAEKPDSED